MDEIHVTFVGFDENDKKEFNELAGKHINSVSYFGGTDRESKKYKVDDLNKLKDNIVSKLSNSNKEQIKPLLIEFAKKANEYRKIQKDTASFLKFKSEIRGILDHNDLKSEDQKPYTAPKYIK